MLRKLFMNKKITLLLILLGILLTGATIFLMRPKNQIKGVDDKIGTVVEYKDGKYTKKTFGGIGKEDIYKIGFLPTLIIKDNSDRKWDVTETILNDKDGQFNANIIFKHNNINIVFSIIGDNKTLEAGKTCFANDELEKLDTTWTRERMYEVSGQQTGYLFMKNINYQSTPENIKSDYTQYVELQKQLTLPIKEQNIITSCSSQSRMNRISINPQQGPRDGLVRMFYNKGIDNTTKEELEIMDTFIKNTIF